MGDQPTQDNPVEVDQEDALIQAAREEASITNDTVPNPSPPQSASGPMIPKNSFPGYAVVRELGRGGQGVVYQAIQLATKQKVAIKVLLGGVTASPKARRAFEREIEYVAQLRHPNIISIFHTGETREGMPFCVMDFIRGTPLTAYIRKNKLTLEDSLTLYKKICDAVSYAHQKGVIHRDLKPSNILVDADGELRLLDFGLAKRSISTAESMVSISGHVVGTMPYMSPEQARGQVEAIDTRTDVYSLGVILYELLTGCFPYPVEGSIVEVVKHITETQPMLPSRAWKVDSGVTHRTRRRNKHGQCPIEDDLQTIVMKTLSKDRDRRYQSAGELVRDIDHYLNDEPIEAKRDSVGYLLKMSLRRHRQKLLITTGWILMIVVGLSVGSVIKSNSPTQQIKNNIKMIDNNIELLEKNIDDQNWKSAENNLQEALLLANDSIRLGANQPEFDIKLADIFADFARLELHKLKLRKDLETVAYLRAIEKYCHEAINLIPDHLVARSHLGVVRKIMGDYEGAVVIYDQVLAINPDVYYGLVNKGNALILAGKFQEGAVLIEKSTTVDQQCRWSVDTHRSLGSLQLFRGESEMALESLKIAKECDPNDWATHMLLARCVLLQGNHTQAFADLAVAEHCLQGKDQPKLRRKIQPKLLRLHALLALRMKDFKSAASKAQEAISEGDEKTINYLIIAAARANKHLYDDAKIALQQAEDTWPEQLRTKGGFIPSAEDGILWFDTADELLMLKKEAEEAMVAANP